MITKLQKKIPHRICKGLRIIKKETYKRIGSSKAM